MPEETGDQATNNTGYEEAEEAKGAVGGNSPSPITTTSTTSTTSEQKFSDFFKKIEEAAKKNPDLIKFDSRAKKAFEDISTVLSTKNATEDRVTENAGKIEAINKILKGKGEGEKEGEGEGEGRKIDDSGLNTFAKIATRILNIDSAYLSDDSAYLSDDSAITKLITEFGFLKEDPKPEDPPGNLATFNPLATGSADSLKEDSKEEDSKEEFVKSILGALRNASSSFEGDKAVTDAINLGFKDAFPEFVEEIKLAPDLDIAAASFIEGGKLTQEGQESNETNTTTVKSYKNGLTTEEQELVNNREINWSNAIEIMPDAFRGGTALALALAVPAPFGVILALGFLACAWNMGHKPEEENLNNDPLIKACSTAWKDFMEEKKSKSDEGVSIEVGGGGREITEEDRENYERNPTRTGGAADKVIGGSAKDLEEDKKALVTTSEALRVKKTESTTNSAELNEKLITELEEAVKSEITKSDIEEENVLVEKESEAIDARAPASLEELEEALQDDAGSNPISGKTTTTENVIGENFFVEDTALKGVTGIDGLQVTKNTIRNSTSLDRPPEVDNFSSATTSVEGGRNLSSLDRPQPSTDHSGNNPLNLFVYSEEEESSEEEVSQTAEDHDGELINKYIDEDEEQTAEDHYSELINRYLDEDEKQTETNREEYHDPPVRERLETAILQIHEAVAKEVSTASSSGKAAPQDPQKETVAKSNTSSGR